MSSYDDGFAGVDERRTRRRRLDAAVQCTAEQPPYRFQTPLHSLLANQPHNHGNGIGMPEMRPSPSTLLPFITVSRRPAASLRRQLARRENSCLNEKRDASYKHERTARPALHPERPHT